MYVKLQRKKIKFEGYKMIYLFAYLTIGCLFTFLLRKEIFPNPDQGYRLSTIVTAILCGPIAIAGMLFLELNYFINSFMHRVFR